MLTVAQFAGHGIPEGVQAIPAAPASSPTQVVLWALLGVVLLVVIVRVAIRLQRDH